MSEEVRAMNLFIKEFRHQAALLAPKILSGGLIFLAFWVSAGILKSFMIRAGLRTRIEPDLIFLLARSAQIVVVIFGLVTALGTIGIDVGALIAGLGLSSFAMGFAFKDALSNLLAGVFILSYRPFRVGDRISVTGLEGRIAHIDLRYTTLDAGDKKILVPNANLFSNPVIILNPDTGTPKQGGCYAV